MNGLRHGLKNWRVFGWVVALISPAAASFVFPYLLGRGVIPYRHSIEVFAGTLAMPVLCSTAVMFCARLGFWKRALFVVMTFVLQVALMLLIVPPHATTEMIGFADRFRGKFNTAELESAALELLKRDRAGTIVWSSGSVQAKTVFGEAGAVDKSILPGNLSGRFKAVLLPKAEAGKVIFAVGPEYGLFFSEETEVNNFWHRKVSGRIYAYRYLRP
jgi:hypothetical protein